MALDTTRLGFIVNGNARTENVMKKLWAPWRLEYIRGDKGDDCFLCRILEDGDDRTNLIVKRGRHCAVVLNRYPYNNGHLMIFPCRHINGPVLMTKDEQLETMQLLAQTLEALRATIRPDGFNVGINLGEVAGAGLKEHVHMHVVPRWNGDTSYMPVTADVKVIPQSLLELWDELHPALNQEPPAAAD